MKKINNIEHQLTNAIGCHQKGDYDQAQKIYKKIIEQDPKSFDATHLLGVTFLQNEQFANALQYIDLALTINSQQANVWSNRSLALKGLERFDEALESAEKAIKLDPNFPETYYNKANILANIERLKEGVEALNQFTSLSPKHFLGFYVKGNLLRQLERKEEAILAYQIAAELNPNFSEAFSNLGLCLADLGDLEGALINFEKALELKPQFNECQLNKGAVLEKLGHYDQAIDSFNIALRQDPNFLAAYQNKGVALEKKGDLEAAITCYDTAIAIDKNYVAVIFNRAYVNERLQNLDEAIRDYDRVITLNPERVDTHWNRALTLLCKGDYENGWKAYESRVQLDHAKNSYETEKLKIYEWQGIDQSLQGKTLLVRSEQGLGDTLQFCRYVKILNGMGARIVLEVQPPLLNVLKNLEGLHCILAKGDPLPIFDYYCNLMSLPFLMGTSISTIPNETPYLKADPEKVKFWRQKLGPKVGKRVGLVWSGGFRPDQPELWPLNKRRNIELTYLKDFKTEGIEFHSLQKGELPESELVVLYLQNWDGPKIINHADLLIDFSDTAALIENLDLVISVDTSTAHLAGALGKSVWLMNRFDTCWRWFLERDDSPWYPTIRIFRQPAPGDWDSVVRQIASELKLQ